MENLGNDFSSEVPDNFNLFVNNYKMTYLLLQIKESYKIAQDRDTNSNCELYVENDWGYFVLN